MPQARPLPPITDELRLKCIRRVTSVKEKNELPFRIMGAASGSYAERIIPLLARGDIKLKLETNDDPWPGECWIAPGRLASKSKRPAILHDEKTIYAYRVMMKDFLGGKEPDETVHHVCKNPMCIRPDHGAPLSKKDHAFLEGLEKMNSGNDPIWPKGFEDLADLTPKAGGA